MKTAELPKYHYIFGNKGSVWSNKAHAAKSGEPRTLCGVPMLSSNYAYLEGIQEIGCPECLKKLKK